MSADVHVNDWGTKFVITIKDEAGAVVDVSSASTRKIYFTKPNGELLTNDAGFMTDGTDGKIQYTTIEGDVDIPGTWKVQGMIETAEGEWSSDITEFEVEPNLT